MDQPGNIFYFPDNKVQPSNILISNALKKDALGFICHISSPRQNAFRELINWFMLIFHTRTALVHRFYYFFRVSLIIFGLYLSQKVLCQKTCGEPKFRPALSSFRAQVAICHWRTAVLVRCMVLLRKASYEGEEGSKKDKNTVT